MARQRSAPAPARSSSAAASRPKPAASSSAAPASAYPQAPPAHAQPAQAAAPASSGGWFSRPAAPPPAPSAPAPPPAMSQGSAGGGMLSGIMGSVVTGVAMGTGSAIAHRAVDSMMGPRETKVVHEHAGAPAAAPMAAAPMSQEGPCGGRVKEFADCMSRNNGDMQACNFYFEAMQACKTEAGYRV